MWHMGTSCMLTQAHTSMHGCSNNGIDTYYAHVPCGGQSVSTGFGVQGIMLVYPGYTQDAAHCNHMCEP